MSVFIAILGIVITLLLSVYERRRELGLMRAVGTTRGQVRGSVRWEAILTALIGAVMGVVLGLVLGWVVVRALRDQGLTAFAVPTTTIVIFTALAIVFAIVAAWWPARRAARVRHPLRDRHRRRQGGETTGSVGGRLATDGVGNPNRLARRPRCPTGPG